MENFYTKDLLSNLGDLVEIGDFTYGKPEILHWGEPTKLKIGKFCSIADGVKIFLGGNHRSDWITTYPFSALTTEWPEAKDIIGHPASNGNVVIGNDVWIGNGAVILSGVKIGDGAIVGANAVIRKNVPPYSIFIGNPAIEIRKRFDKETIERLLNIKWWDWPIEKIRDNVASLCNTDLRFLENI